MKGTNDVLKHELKTRMVYVNTKDVIADYNIRNKRTALDVLSTDDILFYIYNEKVCTVHHIP